MKLPHPHVCNCVGPQNGEPYCRCQMEAKGVFIRDGRYVLPARPEMDLGPAVERDDPYRALESFLASSQKS